MNKTPIKKHYNSAKAVKALADLSKVTIRFSKADHSFEKILADEVNKKTTVVPCAIITPLTKPYQRLPYPLQNDKIRLIAVNKTMFVISGFKELDKQMSKGTTVIAYVYTPKELTTYAIAEAIKPEEISAAVDKLSNHFSTAKVK